MSDLGEEHTPTNWPPPPLRQEALQVALQQLGQRETAPNHGPIVDWACEGFTTRQGLRWCAYFVCQAFRRALLRRQDPAQLASWMRLASGDCDALWRNLSILGWTWLARGDSTAPGPGDLVFFGTEDDLDHVGLVKQLDTGLLLLHDVEGNRGDAVAERAYPLSAPRLHGYARVPW